MSFRKTIAIILAISLLFMVACGGPKDSATGSSSAPKVLDPIQMADDMLAALAPQGEMIAVEDSVLDNYYAVSKEVIEGYKIYISTSFIAEEIAVFSVMQGKEADAQKMLEARISDLKDSFDGYLPEELASVEANARILVNGNLICLLIGEGDGLVAAEKLFNEGGK